MEEPGGGEGTRGEACFLACAPLHTPARAGGCALVLFPFHHNARAHAVSTQAPLKSEFVMHMTDGGPVDALCGFFDVLFKGSDENPTDNEIRLSTAPDPTGKEQSDEPRAVAREWAWGGAGTRGGMARLGAGKGNDGRMHLWLRVTWRGAGGGGAVGMTAGSQQPCAMPPPGRTNACLSACHTLLTLCPDSPPDYPTQTPPPGHPSGATHWGQQTFPLHPPIDCAPGDRLRVSVEVTRRADNQRLLHVKAAVSVEGNSIYAEQSKTPREFRWNIE